MRQIKSPRELGRPEEPTAPNMRSFSLNGDEAYEALCPRQDQPWIMAGSLPREPPARERMVIVEAGRIGSRS